MNNTDIRGVLDHIYIKMSRAPIPNLWADNNNLAFVKGGDGGGGYSPKKQ